MRKDIPSWLMKLDFLRANMSDEDYSADSIEKEVIVHPEDANLISSHLGANKHILMLDLDVQHYYTESTSNGHLYINHPLEFEDMMEVLTVLNKHGIIQDGIINSAKRRGYTGLRVPGLSKHDKEGNEGIKNAENK